MFMETLDDDFSNQAGVKIWAKKWNLFDVDQTIGKRYHVFDVCFSQKRYGFIKDLCEVGVSPVCHNRKGETALGLAIWNDNPELMNLFIHYGAGFYDIPSTTDTETSPLFALATHPGGKCLRDYLSKGGNPNACIRFSHSAIRPGSNFIENILMLQEAISERRTLPVKILLVHGARVCLNISRFVRSLVFLCDVELFKLVWAFVDPNFEFSTNALFLMMTTLFTQRTIDFAQEIAIYLGNDIIRRAYIHCKGHVSRVILERFFEMVPFPLASQILAREELDQLKKDTIQEINMMFSD